jgi:hypothetical protein
MKSPSRSAVLDRACRRPAVRAVGRASVPSPGAAAGTVSAPPKLLGIVNITEDSFSDGGRYLAPEAALAHARAICFGAMRMHLDLGRASSNPDAKPVAPDVEIARLAPVVEALKTETALAFHRQLLARGSALGARARMSTILNDIQGFPHAALYPDLAASRQADRDAFGPGARAARLGSKLHPAKSSSACSGSSRRADRRARRKPASPRKADPRSRHGVLPRRQPGSLVYHAAQLPDLKGVRAAGPGLGLAQILPAEDSPGGRRGGRRGQPGRGAFRRSIRGRTISAPTIPAPFEGRAGGGKDCAGGAWPRHA